MKLFGTLLALGGAMSLQVEDLTYDKMRGAFSKVRKFSTKNFKKKKFEKKFSKISKIFLGRRYGLWK